MQAGRALGPLSVSGLRAPTRLTNCQQSQQRRHKRGRLESTSNIACVLWYYVTGLRDNAAPASGTVTLPLRQTLAQSQHRWLGTVNGGVSRRWREDGLLQNTLEERAKPFLPPLSPRPAEMEAHPGLRKSPTMHRFTFPTLLQLQSHSSPASTNVLFRAWQRKKG